MLTAARDLRVRAACRADKTSRAIEEHLAVLDDAPFGAASEKQPRFISATDPASR
jgi:hypothetical protein